MASSILSIGQTGLTAAQAGLNTTAHNISNSATPGYSRQLVVQGTAGGQDFGFGFIGKGTGVDDVRRVYSDYLGTQVTTAQTSKYHLDTYLNQISRINNQFADPAAGLTPAMQDFFKGTQDLAGDPNSGASRQSLISSAQSMVARFQSLYGQLNEMRQGVNSQLTAVVSEINVFAAQISALNDSIERAVGVDGHPPNDLLDQRDQVISDLSKSVQVSVAKQGNSYSVFIGTGQPLVVGTQTFKLAATPSPTDLSRTTVGYVNNGVVTVLSESALTGGKIGGLFDFRTNALDVSQNSLGRIAIGLGTTFNTQHQLGQDQNGALGGAFFNVASPVVNVDTANPAGNAVVTATISNVAALTLSDYNFRVTVGSVPGPAAYQVTRLSDGVVTNITPPATLPQTIDGVDFNMAAGPQTAGDNFIVRPTANGANAFTVAISDPAKVAAAAPARTNATSTNVGSGRVSPAVVSSTAMVPQLALTYAGGNMSGFSALLPITVTTAGVPTTYPVGTVTVPYPAGSTIAVGGFNINGLPAVAGTYHVGGASTLPAFSLTYNAAAAPNTLSGFPATSSFSITTAGPVTTTYPAGTGAVPYVAGDIIRVDGFTIPGVQAVNGTYTAGPFNPTLTFASPANTLTLSPPYLDVTVTPSGGGASTTYAAGTAIPYTAGSTISYGGVSFVLSGSPSNGDTFTTAPNTNGVGDNRNALLLGGLQAINTLAGSTITYQGAYSQLVNLVGNKTRELDVTSAAQTRLLSQAVQAQQSESGVNLDEEATNLMRFQQAYQAAGKVMQTANTLFDVLLQLGN